MERVDAKSIREFEQSRMERFGQEKAALRLLPEASFEYRLPKPLLVSREGMITVDTNRYSVPAAYRGRQLEGLLDLTDKTLTLRYDGKVIRTLTLKPYGAKEKTVDPVDEREHFEAWEKGRDFEERIRLQIKEKRERAKIETVTADPSVYDMLFECTCQDVAMEAVL